MFFGVQKQKSAHKALACMLFGGGCEIRTHGRLPVGSFQDCWVKPLPQASQAP
jgi:hypothetical protein